MNINKFGKEQITIELLADDNLQEGQNILTEKEAYEILYAALCIKKNKDIPCCKCDEIIIIRETEYDKIVSFWEVKNKKSPERENIEIKKAMIEIKNIIKRYI